MRPDAMGRMNELSVLWDRLQGLGVSALQLIPGLGVALVVMLFAYGVAKLVRMLTERSARRFGRHANAGIVLGRLVQFAILVLGLLIGATVAFPSFRMSDLVTTLGLTSVALGFAFRDILQNFLAGILILWTRPFTFGDQIVYKELEGTVVDIQTRATFVDTYDGRRIVIPNGELFTNAVIVNTANESRRIEYDVGIGVGDDIDRAKAVILDALAGLGSVLPEPAADVQVFELGDFSVKLRVRWWIAPPRRNDVIAARDEVLARLTARLLEEGIDLPYPTTQVLFHDQTEETDGDRRRQREGWPAGRGEVPRPRRAATRSAT